MSLTFEDKLHGTVQITAPVLIDVLNSQAVQRLHGVLQHGITGLVGITPPVSRFEHSLGVMLLVRRMGGSQEEQVAALLHDVSHTAFSHVIDYVVGDLSQSYHDEVKADYVAGTDLPAVLAAHGLDWQRVIDEERYPLLEQPAPALCADRLDYFLRDAPDLGLVPLAECRDVMAHLVVHEGRIKVDSLEAAHWMATYYMQADQHSWANYFEVGIYELTARAIRRGLTLGVITEADFWRTDAEVWETLQAVPDPELRDLMALVQPDTRFVWDVESPDFSVETKIRTLDPDVVLNGISRPLSDLDPDFAAERVAYLERTAGPWPFRIVRTH